MYLHMLYGKVDTFEKWEEEIAIRTGNPKEKILIDANGNASVMGAR